MRQTTKSPVRTNGHVTNGVDLDNLTGTETETEDDMPADIPASLRSSQLSGTYSDTLWTHVTNVACIFLKTTVLVQSYCF